MSEETNIADRRRKNQLWQKIPETARPKVQQNYDVSYSNVEEPMTKAGRRINVNAPKYTEKGESGE